MVAARVSRQWMMSGGRFMFRAVYALFRRSAATALSLVCLCIFASLLCFAAPVSLHAAGGDLVWESSDARSGKQEGYASAVDKQGNTIIAGFHNSTGGVDDDYLTVKFKSDGSGVLWRSTFDLAAGTDQVTALAVDADNNVIVTGTVWNGLNTDIHTIKYDGSTGEVLWQRTYNGTANGNETATSVAVDSLNNIYVGGYSQSLSGDDDILLLKYSPSGGAPLWQVISNGPAGGNDQLMNMAVGLDAVGITGQSWNGTAFEQYTALYDLFGGLLWEKRKGATGGPTASAGGKFVKIDSTGNLLVTGYTTNSIDRDMYTVSYSAAAGDLLWEQTYNGAYDDEPSGIWIDASGDLYVTGYTWTLAGNNDFYTVKYQGTTGVILWEKGFDSGGGNTDVAIPTGIVLDEQGDLFVTGYTVASGNYDFQTIKYRKDNGNQLWHASYNGASSLNDRPVGIGLSSSGQVLVAGWSATPANDLDLLVLQYDAGALSPPTALSATALSSTSVQLSWTDNSNNEEGFKIERKQGEFGDYTLLTTVGPDVSSYTDNELSANNYYYYRVRSYNATNGDSHYSNESHALTVFAPVILPGWTYLYNSPDNFDDFIAGVAVGPDNNPVVTGYSLRVVGGFDYFTVKLNHGDSSVAWSALYDDTDSELDKATCVAVDSGNNIVVSGFSSLFYAPADKNINSIYTLKYPSAGPPEVWGAQYNGPGAIDDRATAIATTTDAANNSIVIGYGKNSSENEDLYVVKYASDGTRLWHAAPFDGGGTDIPSAVTIAPDGSVYIAGMSESVPGTSLYSLFVGKYNGSTGALIWSDRYSVTAGGDNRARGLAVSSDGNLYITGYAVTVGGTRDIYTIKYDGSASVPVRLWERSFDGAGHGDDEAVAVSVDPIDGAVIVGGTTLSAQGDHDSILLRYTPSGDLVWQKIFLRPAHDDYVTAMTMDSSGYIYLAGSTSNALTMDVISLLYDFEGTLLGVTTFNGAANKNDEAASVAVNYLGEAFISGYSENADSNADYLVLKQSNPYILAPAPFTLTPEPDPTIISLSWGESTPGTGFHLERTLAPVSEESVWTLIETLPSGVFSYQDTGLNPGSAYCYRIEAYTGGLASRKAVVCGSTTVGAPTLNPVTVLSATAIDLSWTNLAGNTGYILERKAGSGNWAQVGSPLPQDTVIYHDTGLTAGTVYSYRLKVLNSGGASLPSQVQTAPVLNAPSGITSGKIDLSWPVVPEATGYLLERSVDSVLWSPIASPAAADVSYSDTTVASGLLYLYRLKAVTVSEPSGGSLAQSARALLTTPTVTATAAVSTTQISADWTDPNTNETGYTLQYSRCDYSNIVGCQNNLENPDYWLSWVNQALPTDSTTFTVNGLAANSTYRFRVVATLAGGDSLPSPPVLGSTKLVPPSNLKATAATESSITLTWSDVNGESNYNVIQDGVVLSGTGLPLGVDVTSFTVSGLAQNTPYCFKVQPFNSFTSADSNQSCVTLSGAATLTSLTVGQTQITVNWTDVSGESGYEVWRSTARYQHVPPESPDTGFWNAYTNLTTTPLPANTLFYLNTGIAEGMPVKYKIRFKLPDATFSPFSNELMAITVPKAPSVNTLTNITSTQIRLNWSDMYNETACNVQTKTRISGDCATEDWTGIPSVQVVKDASYYVATALSSGTTYCFRLNSENAYGVSPWSPSSTGTTLLPAPTLNPLAGITQSKIDLSWSTVTGNTGYAVERSTDSSNWTQIATVAADSVTYSDTTVAPNQKYYYRITTKNSVNAYSAPSNIQSGTTLFVTAPVLNTPDSVTTSQVRLTWDAVPDNAGYKVEQSTNGTEWTQVALPATGSVSYTQTGLSAGTLYHFRIMTMIGSGGFSSPSNVQSVTTTSVPPVVSATVASASQVDLSWKVVPGATHYSVFNSIGPDGPWDQAANLPVAYTTLYCGKDPAPSIGCPTLLPITTVYEDQGLAADTNYCFQVKSWSATGGDSEASSTVCQKTSAVGGPVLLAVTPLDAMKIELLWSYLPSSCAPTPCIDADGFEIWRQLVTGGWARIASVSGSSRYVDSLAIEPVKKYSYRIRAFKGSEVSAFSSVREATTPAFTSNAGTCP